MAVRSATPVGSEASASSDHLAANELGGEKRGRTSIYLSASTARRLKHIAADEGKKVHDLFMEGIEHVLSRRPALQVDAESRRLRAEAQAHRLERDLRAAEVEEKQAALAEALKSQGRWRKGVDPAASKLFWDGVLMRAADVLRGQRPMTAEAVLERMTGSAKAAAAAGGSPMTAAGLARMMSRRAKAGKVFREDDGGFRLREG